LDLRIKAAVISIAVNILLIVFKFFLAGVSGSASVHADAWHSISDLMVSAFVLGGLKVTTTTEKRNLVNWRGLEHVMALVVGVFILYTGWRIFGEALRQPTGEIGHIGWVMGGALLCVLASYLIATMKIRVGTIKDSPCLIADGYHSKMDVYSTVAVIVGLFGVMIGINLDRVAAGIVSIFIGITGVEIIVGSVKAIARGAAITDYFLSFVFEAAGGEHRRGRVARGIAGMFGWLGGGHRYAYMIAGLVVLVWGLSGVYAIRQGEAGMAFRFGRLERSNVAPGLHYHAPSPVERVEKIPMDRVQRIEIGFRSLGRAAGSARAYQWESRHQTGSYEKRLDESLVFTGDENIIDINTVIQYRVKDPIKYILSLADPATTVASYARESLRRVVAVTAIDQLLTTDRIRIEAAVAASLQDLLDRSDSGIELIGVELQDVHPPVEVVAAFREVASAREDKNRMVNQAEAYRDSLIPDARGSAAQLVSEAEGMKIESVQHATGEADRFQAMVKQYQKSRDVTEIRMYLETMETVLPGLDKFIVEPGLGAEPLDLRFFDENVTVPKGGW
jgi:membrane protease subunit HflK